MKYVAIRYQNWTHCLPAFNTRTRHNSTVTWSKHVKIRCHVIVTQKSPTVEQSAFTFRNLSLQIDKAGDRSELQTHHCTTPGQWTWFLCSVGVIPANILSMQKLNQFGFNRNWTADFRFSRNFEIFYNFEKRDRMTILPHYWGRPHALSVVIKRPCFFWKPNFKLSFIQLSVT